MRDAQTSIARNVAADLLILGLMPPARADGPPGGGRVTAVVPKHQEKVDPCIFGPLEGIKLT
jgi:predicted phosphohydrolase